MRVNQMVTDLIKKSILTTRGDMVVRGATDPERLAVGGANEVMVSDGTDPGWGVVYSLLTTQGDMVVRGATAAQRLVAAANGLVLKSKGAGVLPAYEEIYSILTTKGDMLMRATTAPARLPAGDLGFNLQGMGPGEMPIWARPNLKAGGLHHAAWTSTDGELKQIRGCGFEPSLLFLYCNHVTDAVREWSIGWAINTGNGITQYCFRHFEGGSKCNFTVSGGNVFTDALNKMVVTVDDFVIDGYDVDLVETGNAPVDVRVTAIA